jgi:hypothetical protein
MSTFKKLLAFSPVVALLLVLTAPTARADTFTLTEDHCTGLCGPPFTTFGFVKLTQNGTAVDVDVTLNSPYEFAKTGAGDMQAFKFNATGVTLSDITVTQTVAGQTLGATTGAFNGDHTGSFSFGIACTTCGGGLSDAFSNDIKFEVANATIADLTPTNNYGFVFAADIGNPQTGKTGPVAALPILRPEGTLTPVPEPATIWLFSSVLVGLGIVRKRAAFARVTRNNQ